MRTNSWISALTLGLALSATACSKDSDSCATLKQKVAKAAGVSTDKVSPLIDKELTGPSGEPLASDQRQAACKMIVSEKDALEGYTASIKAQLK